MNFDLERSKVKVRPIIPYLIVYVVSGQKSENEVKIAISLTVFEIETIFGTLNFDLEGQQVRKVSPIYPIIVVIRSVRNPKMRSKSLYL